MDYPWLTDIIIIFLNIFENKINIAYSHFQHIQIK